MDISGVTERAELPEAARKYVEFIEQGTGVPAEIISVGPKRTQTILTREEYKSPIEEGPYLYREDFDAQDK